MTYVTPDMVDDETTVAEATLAGVADRIDGWEPSEGHLETALGESTGVAIATAVTELKATVLDAYLGFGLRILGIARGAAAVAGATSTWTLDPTAALTSIDAGTEVQATLPDGTTQTFIVPESVDVPAGAAVVLGVPLVSVEAGPESNGATNPARNDSLVGVVGVVLDAPADGGADPEDPDAYADKVSDRARRLHTIPITVEDHAAFATDVAVVDRAVAVNLLDPANPGVASTGHITIYALAAGGALLDAAQKAEVVDYFAAIERPMNVTVHVEDLTLVDVAVVAEVRVADGWDPADVEARAEAAITDRFSRATWDANADAPGGWASPRSTEATVFDASAAIDDLDGLASVVSVTINGGTAPVALPGPVSLPNLTSVTVTAV